MAQINTVDQSMDDGVPEDFFDELHEVVDGWNEEFDKTKVAKEKNVGKRMEKKQADVDRFNDMWNISKPTSSDRSIPRDPRLAKQTEESKKREEERRRDEEKRRDDDRRRRDEERRRDDERRYRRSDSPEAVYSRSRYDDRSRGTYKRRSRSRSPPPRRRGSRSPERRRSPPRRRAADFLDELAKKFAEQGQSFPELEQLKNHGTAQGGPPLAMPNFQQSGPPQMFPPHMGYPQQYAHQFPVPVPMPVQPPQMQAPMFKQMLMNPMPPGQMMNPVVAPEMLYNPFNQNVAVQPAPMIENNELQFMENFANPKPKSRDPRKKAVANEMVEDINTQLYKEKKISLSEYLASEVANPEKSNKIKVISKITQAIEALEHQEDKTYDNTATFRHVTPTYFEDLIKVDNRSPLVWNQHNVRFLFTSKSKEVKLCEPFKNVSHKFKGMVEILGLDEGIISKRIQKYEDEKKLLRDISFTQQAEARKVEISEKRKTIQGESRNKIDRGIQTDPYRCKACVLRSSKTYISESTQTVGRSKTMDKDIQTDMSGPGSMDVPIHGLTTRQVNIINEIKKFMMNRSTPSVDSLRDEMRMDVRRSENELLYDGYRYVDQLTNERMRQESRYTRGEPSFASAHSNIDFDMINALRPAGFRDSPPRKIKKKKFIN